MTFVYLYWRSNQYPRAEVTNPRIAHLTNRGVELVAEAATMGFSPAAAITEKSLQVSNVFERKMENL